MFNNSPVPVRHADWNCDGEVTVVDGLALLRFIAGLSALLQHEPCTDVGDPISVLSLAGSAGERIAGDTDCDGAIDAVDSLAILRHVVSLPVPPPPLALGCPGLGEFP